jgi:hypothetical protein
MAKKTKEQAMDDLLDMINESGESFFDVIERHLTRAELERIAKKVRKDSER